MDESHGIMKHEVTRGVHRTHTPRGMSTGRYSAATIDDST